MLNKALYKTGDIQGGVGVKYMVTEHDLTVGGGHSCNLHVMYHKNVHLKPIYKRKIYGSHSKKNISFLYFRGEAHQFLNRKLLMPLNFIVGIEGWVVFEKQAILVH